MKSQTLVSKEIQIKYQVTKLQNMNFWAEVNHDD